MAQPLNAKPISGHDRKGQIVCCECDKCDPDTDYITASVDGTKLVCSSCYNKRAWENVKVGFACDTCLKNWTFLWLDVEDDKKGVPHLLPRAE